MRILAAADIHSSNQGARTIRDAVLSEKPDLTLVCGDITHFGPLAWAKAFLEDIPGDVLAIPGNCDPPEMVSLLDNQEISLHAERVTHGGCTFIGLGGSSPTPFHTPFELSEDEIWDELSSLMKPGVILVTHDAPRGHLDITGMGDSVGSTAIDSIVRKHSPIFSVFGHIHESPGIQRESTIFINPGPAMSGNYAIIDTDTREILLKGQDVRSSLDSLGR